MKQPIKKMGNIQDEIGKNTNNIDDKNKKDNIQSGGYNGILPNWISFI